jgi:hypothetical protein
MKGGSASRSSRSLVSGSRSKGTKTDGSFEAVPEDEEAGDEDESQYSDEQDEEEESSYESDLNTSKESTHQTFNIAQKESNRVQVWRTVLSLMLVATAAVVIVTTYLFLVQNEENEFQAAVRRMTLLIYYV